MSLTRTHVAFLAIISIFTGMIGPTTSIGSTGISYLMTNMGVLAFLLLILLVIAFYSSAIKSWGTFRMSLSLVITGLVVLFFLNIFGQIQDIKSGTVAHGIAWGWVFLLIGILLSLGAYHDWHEEKHSFSDTVDTFIGILGSVALLIISALIFLSSYNHFFPGYKKQNLSDFMGGQSVETLSGGIQISRPYTALSNLSFDRKKDTLGMLVGSGGVQTYIYLSKGTSYAHGIEEGLTPVLIGDTLYKINVDGKVFSGNTLMKNMSFIAPNSIISNSGNISQILSSGPTWSLNATGSMEKPLLSANKNTIAWQVTGSDGKISIIKQGQPIGVPYDQIETITLSPTGSDIMVLADLDGKKSIFKNGEKLADIPAEMIDGSYRSNGSEYVYQISHDNTLQLVMNGEVGEKKYEEIREVLLEDDGYSYGYFARPIGEKTYCLFTRYKGNLCGITSYMNPKLGADGGSILFAGKKDGSWSIYRNTEKIVKDTGYASEDIRYDYAFFDTTNPRTFLFIKKEGADGTYQLIKNGTLLPKKWKDVGLDVTFGFDDQIIMSAEDEKGWHVVQL